MLMQKLEGRLAVAERRVATGKRLLNRQTELVARQRRAGLDTAQAERLRRAFEAIFWLLVQAKEVAAIKLYTSKLAFRRLH